MVHARVQRDIEHAVVNSRFCGRSRRWWSEGACERDTGWGGVRRRLRRCRTELKSSDGHRVTYCSPGVPSFPDQFGSSRSAKETTRRGNCSDQLCSSIWAKRRVFPALGSCLTRTTFGGGCVGWSPPGRKREVGLQGSQHPRVSTRWPQGC